MPSPVGLPPRDRAVITALYVPGDRPDRFEKAVASGADMVIFDLEDAVAPDRKAFARDAVVGWFRERASEHFAAPLLGAPLLRAPLFQVRVNAGDDADLDALARLAGLAEPREALDGRATTASATTTRATTASATILSAAAPGAPAPAAIDFTVRLPKVERSADLDRVSARLPGRGIAALIETAVGVEAAGGIAGHPAVVTISLGDSDLASDIGSAHPAVLDYARLRLVFAARAAGLVPPMIGAYPGIHDAVGLASDTERGRALGMVGRTAIHPAQVATIAAVFRPTSLEIAWADEVVAATSGGGVSTLGNGDMVDDAMRGRAERILWLAGGAAE